MSVSGWIGVDLDGTLAVYNGWNDGRIGEPVPLMAQRVKDWLAEGVKVKIMTARVSITGGFSLESNAHADQEFADEQRKLIQDWTEKHFGQRLEVTCMKDFTMIQLWDDRCVQVELNTGRRIG